MIEIIEDRKPVHRESGLFSLPTHLQAIIIRDVLVSTLKQFNGFFDILSDLNSMVSRVGFIGI